MTQNKDLITLVQQNLTHYATQYQNATQEKDKHEADIKATGMIAMMLASFPPQKQEWYELGFKVYYTKKKHGIDK